MQLRKLIIQHFKNLRAFEIEFGPGLTTVLLGQNGSGKSNLLEALTILFRDLDLGAEPTFAYWLEYECRGSIVQIDANHERTHGDRVRISVHEPGQPARSLPYDEQFYRDPQRSYLPAYLVGASSSSSNPLEQHFIRHQETVSRALLAGQASVLCPFLYARPVYGQFALLMFFLTAREQLNESGQSMGDFLHELLGLERLVSALFILRDPRPPHLDHLEGAHLWQAHGSLGNFLEHLYAAAFAPLYLSAEQVGEFEGEQPGEYLCLFLRTFEALKDLYAHYAHPRTFFQALEHTELARVLCRLSLQVLRRGANGRPLNLRGLSEGESQLLTILGLLRFIATDEALFLLDEPDTHLHPSWSLRYLEWIEHIAGRSPSSQVIMATHNPLVVSSLRRESVRIIQRESAQGGSKVLLPRESPLGMGVANILTSEMFGLRYALDQSTQDLLEKRRVLALKDELTLEERQRLAELTGYLDGLGYALTEHDPLYAAFLKRLQQREEAHLRQRVALTPREHRERGELVNEILAELMAEGH